jgi:hypothetical protein
MPRLFVLLLMFALPLPALAATHWLCGLSDDLTRLVCVADVDPLEAAPPRGEPTATVRGTRFPLDSRQRYSVELWSPPTEAASVELLARATICYRSPGCRVTLALPAYLAQQRRD